MFSAYTGQQKAVFGAAGALALVVAYGAFDYAAATNIRRGNPELAYRLRPTDPNALAAAMNYRIAAQMPLKASAQDLTNTRIALQHEPLNRTVVRTLGVQAELDGKSAEAFKAMAMADRVSRRDSISQMWLAEYLRRDDQPVRSLKHYNAALSVKPDLQKVLLPQMVPALADPRFVAAFRPYVLRNADWAAVLVGTAAQARPLDVLSLMEPLAGSVKGGRYDRAYGQLVLQLASRGEQRRALDLARKAFEGFDIAAFQQLGWNDASQDRRLGDLSWTFTETGDVSAVAEGSNRIVITTLPFSSGEAAARDVLVQPGATFSFRHRVRYESESARPSLRWSAACVTPAGLAAFWQDTGTPQGNAYAGTFTVPAGCHLVRLTLQVFGSDSQLPTEIVVSDLAKAS